MTTGPGMTPTPLPKGFLASGINCGVRKYRPDLGLLLSTTDAVAAAVYTKNECKSASIVYSQALSPSTKIRALVTNSGQANAATGPAGVDANLRMARAVAAAVGCGADQVLTASTGVIGVAMEIDKIERAVPELVARAGENAQPFSLAILTTDLIPKTVTTTLELSGGTVRLTGICKGSGMIHPNMATMLGYFVTDAGISEGAAQAWLSEAVDKSFNMISVDGDTSPNDAVFLLANGASGVRVSTDEDRARFRGKLTEMACLLAQSIARDGEGATKLVEVSVSHAPELTLARRAARGVTISPLVKAALHGEDPNWGRVLARIGAEGVPAEALGRMQLKLQGFTLLSNGLPVTFDRDAVRGRLREDTVRIEIDLGSGVHDAVAWGCDLSKKYVDINAEYST